jgi:L-ectoine synthase
VIVRKLSEMTERTIEGPTWTSRRLLLRHDGMGFSMHDTVLFAGTRTEMHYKNHLEAVYCIEGRGRVTEIRSGTVHELEPGTLYALDENDHHILEAETDIRFVCVFNPPLLGPETHGPDGAYPLLGAD